MTIEWNGEMYKSYCNKCSFYGVSNDFGSHRRPKDGQWCNYTAAPVTNDRQSLAKGESA